MNRRQWLTFLGVAGGLDVRRALAQGVLRAPGDLRNEEKRFASGYGWLTIHLSSGGTPAVELGRL